MRSFLSCGPSGSIPLIDRAPVNPLDPIAWRAAVARSAGQGRRPVFRLADKLSCLARGENTGRRRSLALDRSEHDGRLAGVRDGGSCAAVRVVTATLAACAIGLATFVPVSAEPLPGESATATASTPDGSSGRSPVIAPPADPWAAHIAEATRRFAIPQRWIRAVMLAESVNYPAALSPKGAIGLMQVMPATWDELRAKHGLGNDPWRPRDNILAGTAYLREMHDRYGSISAMLAAYNAGPGRYDNHLATGRALPAETVDYIAKVMPMIDGTVAIAPTFGRPPRPSWSRAPLFAGRSIGDARDDPAAADLPSGSPSETPAIIDLSALAPSPDGLFVRRPELEGARR